MPFQSEKQRRYLHANHPEIAQRWEKEYATGGIANHFRLKNGGTPRRRYFTGAYGGGGADQDKGDNQGGGWSPGVSHSGSPSASNSPGHPSNQGTKSSQTTSSNQGSDKDHSRFDVGSGYYGEPVTTSTKDDGKDDYKDPILGMVKPPQTIHDEILDKHAHRFKSLKDLTLDQKARWAKDKYEDFKTAKGFMSIAAGPFGWLSAGKAVLDAEKRKKETINELEKDIKTLTDLGYPTHHHTVDTLIQSLNQEILDMTQPKDQKDTGGDGPPEIPVTIPVVMDEMADATGQIDMFDAWGDIKQKQALRASLFADEDQAKVGEWVGDQRLLVNSGGLANLFRVKNQ